MPCYSPSGLLHVHRMFFLHRVHSFPIPSRASFSCSGLSFNLLPLEDLLHNWWHFSLDLLGTYIITYSSSSFLKKNSFWETEIQVRAARSGSLIAPPQHMLSLPPLGFARMVTLLLWPVLEQWTRLSSLPATSWLLRFVFLSGPLSSCFF